MTRRWLAAAAISGVFCTTGPPLAGIYIGVETRRVPVARLVSNLEKQLASSPNAPEVHVKLARLYGMAHALNIEEVPVTQRRGVEEVWFGHEPNLVPYRTQPPEATRSAAARNYLKKAIEHYRAALERNPDHLLARIGYGWALEQANDKPGAIAAYRAVIEKAWPREQSASTVEFGQRFYTAEAGEALIPLLDPKADAIEIAELQSRVTRLESVPRPITPIAIPLRDDVPVRSLIDIDAQVRFDADGTGRLRRWTWIAPDAGWLVYDADGEGRITSALQWFGSATFWLPWKNGYDALAALDDNSDGELTGAELRHLGIWADRNRDGISDPGEVRSLSEYEITSLSCAHTPSDGLFIVAESPAGVRFRDGRVRPTYDVILRPSWSVSSPEPW